MRAHRRGSFVIASALVLAAVGTVGSRPASAAPAAPASLTSPTSPTSTASTAPGASAAASVTGGFQPVAPFRLVDTRDGTGGPAAAFGAGEQRDVTVAGRGGVPADAVAVALNVTMTDPAQTGFVTVWPAGAPRPNASNVNAVAGQTVANLVTVGLGGGAVSLYSLSGPTHVVVDVTGWYGNGFHPLQPDRVLDTRDGTGGPAGALAGGAPRDLVLGGAGGVPGSAIAVALNVTAVNPSAAGFLTVWPAGAAQPNASNLNVVPGQTVPNVVLVGLGAGGAVSIVTSSGLTDVVIDVTGWWSAGFHPIVPTRIVDTRAGQCLTRLGPGETRAVGVVGNAGVPAAAGAVALNVTMVNPTAPTYLTVWPSGLARPGSSSVNGRVGVVANLVTVGVGADGRVDLFNAAGTVDVVVDVASWFDGAGPAAPVTGCDVVTPPSAPGALVTDPAPLPSVTIPALGHGGTRDQVLALQSRLQDLGFWAGIPDGTYGQVTLQAVMAFQKYLGLAGTGVVDELTALLLSMQALRPFAESRTGDLMEVDKGRQLLFVIRGGQVLWAVNTSTGSDIPYNEPDQKTGGRATGTAHTPEGRFKVYTEHSDGWELGELGQLYRPKFFIGGVAVHGAPQIPNYPASHGCVRVTTSFMDYVWAADLMPMGSAVWVH